MSNNNTFKESYGVLQRHAQTLRKQTEPNIDDLLSIVEESVAAYRVCQTRIDAVEKALGGATGAATAPAPSEPKNQDTAQEPDDIPF